MPPRLTFSHGIATLLGVMASVATVSMMAPRAVVAQVTRTLTACTPDALALCAELRLSSGPGLFEIALRTIGATGQPLLPVAVYNLILGTGAPPALTPSATLLPPIGVGGAVIGDASDWEVFDTGDALFLSALSNRGVGGCAGGPDVGGFGQAVTTCGAGQFAAFRFVPTVAFDPSAFEILNLEAVALTDPPVGASCGAPGTACVINPSSVPEPSTALLVGGGLIGLLAVGRAARSRRD